jgi:hypothetical protein
VLAAALAVDGADPLLLLLDEHALTEATIVTAAATATKILRREDMRLFFLPTEDPPPWRIARRPLPQ